MPAKFVNKIVLTTEQILEAHAAHGNDMLVIDFDSMREFKKMAQYIDVHVKLADGTITPVRYWKMSSEGIIVSSSIREPEARVYESLRLGTSLADNDGNVNENVQALKLMCEAFTFQIEDMREKKLITDDPKRAKKGGPYYLINTSPKTPLQTESFDKDKEEFVELDVPRVWLSLPKRKFFKPNERYESVHFDNKYYLDTDGQVDESKPVMSFPFAPTMYNIDEWFFHPRIANRKIYRKLGAPEGDDNVLDNTNIQDYLTRNSAIMGNLKFEVAVSARQCKFDVSLCGNCFVKRADPSDNEFNQVDEEVVDAFSSRHANISSSSVARTDIGSIEEDIDDHEL